MREIVIKSLEAYLQKTKLPNKKTLNAIRDVESKKGLNKTKNVDDLFKKLGI